MASDSFPKQRDAVEVKLTPVVNCPNCESQLIEGKCLECGYGFSEEELSEALQNGTDSEEEKGEE